jgi:hypothetical protein
MEHFAPDFAASRDIKKCPVPLYGGTWRDYDFAYVDLSDAEKPTVFRTAVGWRK